MDLVGIAIIGKSYEPLYLFDCSICWNEPAAAKDNDATKTPKNPWGFHGDHLDPNRSLSMNTQLIMHAALDNYNELVTSSINGQMPVIRATNTKHYVGLLLELEDVAVYGYVSATNIKFFAAIRIMNNNAEQQGGSEKGKIDKAMKEFLYRLHQHYITYIMNPFCNTRGPISSKQFDASVKKTVMEFYKNPR
jgi:hypothetical protein